MTGTTTNGSSPARALETRIWALLKADQLKQALPLCQQLNREFPTHVSGWHTASQVADRSGRPDLALQLIEKAVAMEPDNSDWLLQKALCLGRLHQTVALKEVVTQLVVESFSRAYQCSTLALLMTQLEMREEAISLYRQAATLAPDNSQHFYNIAVLQRSLGLMGEAEASLDRAIGLNPADFEAWKVRSELRTQTPGKNHVAALQKLLKRGLDDPRARTHICYALAKELEDLGEYRESFKYLKIGADTRRSYMQYEPETDLSTMRAISEHYVADLFDGHVKGDPNPEPIFIIGMPRTGTTLVERIIASHSDVFAAGELSNFTNALMHQVAERSSGKMPSREDLVALTTSLDFARLGSDYINSTRPQTGHTARFIDKLPLNFLYAGLIHLSLPEARIIEVRRHPVDSCYAIYKQLFVDGYPYSYRLEELANYYVAYDRLMQHWHRLMPGQILTVQYEELVDDVEGESRRLLDYCGLEWQEQCLKFYQSTDASTTASAAQVRKPVYRSSVAKWKNYRDELQALIRILEVAGLAPD